MKKIKKYELFIIVAISLFLFFVSEARSEDAKYKMVRGQVVTALKIVDLTYGGKNIYSVDMVDLLLLTLSVESDFCRNNNGVGSGGEGAFQLNIRNVEDMYKHFLNYPSKKILLSKANHYKTGIDLKNNLTNNFNYAIVMSAIHYKRRLKNWVPSTPWEMAFCWKQVYNTHLGKGNAKEAHEKYIKYCK